MDVIYEWCEDCTDPDVYPGKVFNNGDTSGGEELGQWVECETCNGTGLVEVKQ